ncbi:MAG: hypothetical protein ABEJ88_05475 [Halobacterium sp.]
MSDETVVETDGVTVSKFFNAEDFPVPAVAFDVSSSRDDEVTLSIVDEIPDEFGIDQIGFHPEYGSEHWTASGDGVVRFERDVEPGDSFTTVYGVRMEDGQDEAPFLSAPEVDVQGEDIDEVVPPESTDVVRELAGGERDTVPGLEDEGVEAEVAADVDEDVTSIADDDAEILEGDVDLGGSEPDETGVEEVTDQSPDVDAEAPSFADDEDGEADAAESGAEVASDAEADTETGAATGTEATQERGAGPRAESTEEAVAGDGTEPAEPGFDASDVAGALAEAIRNDEVADEDLETLDDAFGGVSRSTEVEIEHVQSRVSELEAYTDSLEGFIDENGPAQEVLADLEDDVVSLENDLAEVEASVENAADERETLRDRVDDVEAGLEAVADVEDAIERLRGDVEALDERVTDTEEAVLDVEGVDEDVDDLEDDLEDLEETVEEIEQWRDQLSDVFGT